MGKIFPWPLSSKHRRKGRVGGWLLSACRYPRTASFAAGRGGDGDLERAATLEDINRFLHENFKSLYGGSGADEDGGQLVDDGGDNGRRYGSGSSGPPPAPTADDVRGRKASEIVLACSSSSRRFFVSSPGKSGSMTVVDDVGAGAVTRMMGGPPNGADDNASTTTSTTTVTGSAASASSSSPDCQRDTATDCDGDGDGGIPDDGVAVVTFSKDPQDDFLLSMEEMLDAHLCQQQPTRVPALVDWDFMQDLLLCYLHLNDPSVHGHVLQAFADLVAELKSRKDVVLSEEAVKGRGGGGDCDKEEMELTDDDGCCYLYCVDEDYDEAKPTPQVVHDDTVKLSCSSCRHY